MTENKVALVAECQRIETNALWTASSHFTAATWASRVHLVGSSVPIVLGGIGGWAFLKDPQIATPGQAYVAGVMTLASGIVGSLMSFWNLSKTQQEHFQAAVKYKTIEKQACRLREIHAQDDDYATLKAKVLELGKQYDTLGEASTQSSDLMFWLAGRKIVRGLYTTDAPPS